MNKAERLTQELIFLADKKSFNLSDLMDEFQVSRKTAWRDLQELEKLGLAFYSQPGRGGKYFIINEKLLTKIYFNNDEVNAIFFALKALEQMAVTPFSSEYRQIYQKLLKSLSLKNRKKIQVQQEKVNYRQQPSLHQVKYFSVLLKAVIENQVLEIKNSQYYSDKQLVQICEIFYQSGNWFCQVYSLSLKNFFILRCDKISECELAFEVTPYSKQELKEMLAKFEKDYYQRSFSCELTIHNKNQFLLNPYPKMELEKKKDVYLLIGKFNKSELDYLANFLFSLGPGVKILQPADLRSKYLQLLNAMIEKNS